MTVSSSLTATSWTFRRIMLLSALRSSRGVLDRAYRPVDLRDAAEVEKVVNAYRTLTAAPPETKHNIPRTVWMLWQQGWDRAPDLVRACAESWQRENPGWDVKLLDQDSLPDYALGYNEQVYSTLTRQARANMARTMLLHQHGGVWADATLFCKRPLDEWLPQVTRSGFFVFTDPRPYRRLENWFIVGAKGNYFIAAMLELFRSYWQNFKRPHRYYWMMYLMEYLSRADPEARRIWDEMGKLSALGPLVVSRHAFSLEPPSSVLQVIDDKRIPVHKLNHRWNAKDLSGTPLKRLTGLDSIEGSRPGRDRSEIARSSGRSARHSN